MERQEVFTDKNLGRICNIQRLCTHDGPGLRTTVFLKGCLLRCSWCHNPESLNVSYEIGWRSENCIGCGSCIPACEAGLISLRNGKLSINRKSCSLCRKCVEECPSGALIWYGQDISAKALFEELAKDKEYFISSGGGITLSGGEVMMQPQFAKEVLIRCRKAGINTALDTSCYAETETLMDLIKYVDTILIDIKIFDPIMHKVHTGVDNQLILKNILLIAKYVREGNPLKIFVRTPMVNGYTTDHDNILNIGKFIRENLEDVLERWELILFHNMCAAKYAELGREWLHKNTVLVNKSELEYLTQMIQKTGIAKEKTRILGLAIE